MIASNKSIRKRNRFNHRFNTQINDINIIKSYENLFSQDFIHCIICNRILLRKLATLRQVEFLAEKISCFI